MALVKGAKNAASRHLYHEASPDNVSHDFLERKSFINVLIFSQSTIVEIVSWL